MNMQFLDWLWTLLKTFWSKLEKYWRYMVLAVFFGIPSALLFVNALKSGGNILSVLAIFLSLGLLAFAVFVIFHPRVIGALTATAAVAAGLNPKTITPEELKKLSGPVFGYAFLFVLYWIAVPLTVVWVFSLGTNALMLMFLGLLAGIYAIGTNAKGTLIPNIGLALVSGLIVYYLVGAIPFTAGYPKLPYILGAIGMVVTFFGIEPLLGIVLFALTPKKLSGLVLGLIFLSLVILGTWWFFSPQSFETKQKDFLKEHQSAGTFLGGISEGVGKKKEGSAPTSPAQQVEEAENKRETGPLKTGKIQSTESKPVDLSGCSEEVENFPLKPIFGNPVRKRVSAGCYAITTEGSSDQWFNERIGRSFESDGRIMDLTGHKVWLIPNMSGLPIPNSPYGAIMMRVGGGSYRTIGLEEKACFKRNSILEFDVNMLQGEEYYKNSNNSFWSLRVHIWQCDQK